MNNESTGEDEEQKKNGMDEMSSHLYTSDLGL